MIDKDFELQGEAAERQEPKKLTAADIPEGYSYAAVNENGTTYAFKGRPVLFDSYWDGCYEEGRYEFLGGFDPKDWKNSLVSRETAERPKPKKLTASDIPEGFSYAVITPVGTAIATDVAPNYRDWGWDFSEGEFKIIEHGYDFFDWGNSLVSRETAERPQPKKLTAADIPEGYNYAAVNENGTTYAFKGKPLLFDNYWESVYGCYEEGRYEFLGGFDPKDWQNSLVSREAAGLPRFKSKLNWAHIPEGFNYAVVDKNGSAWAFKQKPVVNEKYENWLTDTSEYLFLVCEGFDASDWQNSLVSRETAERPQAEPEALKDQENKPSFLEIDPNFLEAMAWRMTSNKGKYPPNNWQRPHDLLLDVDAIYRHLNDIKRQLEGGKSLTGESIQKHCAAIACNAMFLFYHTQEDQWQRAQRSRQSNAKEI